MKKQKSIVNIWTILITIVVIIIALALIFPGNKSNLSGNSIGTLSIGSSDGLTKTERGTDMKTFSIVPECSPDSGYLYCYQYEKIQNYDSAQARAYIKIQGNDNAVKNPKGGYYVGKVSIPVKFEGDKFYVYENFGTWNNLWDSIAKCDKDGCKNSKRTISQEDEYVLANPGEEYKGCPAFVAFDFDCDGDCFNDNAEEPWAWATISSGWGWPGDSNCLNIKSVECYDNTDCQASEFCNKLGSWQTWSCEVKECNANIDCANLNTKSEPYCSDGNSYVVISNATCSQSNYKCITQDNPTLNDECLIGCSESSGICNEKTPLIIIGAIVVALVVIGAILFFTLRKNKRRR
jgi:hypothetical protein